MRVRTILTVYDDVGCRVAIYRCYSESTYILGFRFTFNLWISLKSIHSKWSKNDYYIWQIFLIVQYTPNSKIARKNSSNRYLAFKLYYMDLSLHAALYSYVEFTHGNSNARGHMNNNSVRYAERESWAFLSIHPSTIESPEGKCCNIYNF